MADHRAPGRPVRATTLVVTRDGGREPAPATEMVEYATFPSREPFGTSVLRRRRTLILAVLAALLSVAAYAWGPGRPSPDRTATPPAARSSAQQPAPDVTAPSAADEGVAGAGSASAGATPSPSKPAPSTASAAPAGGNTPPAGPRNLALSAGVEASSVEGPHLSPSNVVDGNPDTRWGSGFADPQWIRLDLGNQYPLGRITIVWERAYATKYQVEVSADGGTWKKVHETASGSGGTAQLYATGNTARYVKITGLARVSEYGYSILEVAVYTP